MPDGIGGAERLLLIAGLALVAASCSEAPAGSDGDGDADADADAADGGFDGTTCEHACGAGCCGEGERCYHETCIDDVACDADTPCQDDSYCEDGRCVPFGLSRDLDSGCTLPLSPGIFRADVQCEWTGPPGGDPFPAYTKVAHTPLVVDLGIGRGPDDPSHPSIIVATMASFDAAVTGPAVIRILDGATCEQLWTLSEPMVEGVSAPAIGDLDDDGLPDIVAHERGAGLVAWGWDRDAGDWRQIWRSAERTLTTTHALSLADLDDDGRPEVIAGGLVYGSDGALMSDAAGEIGFPTPPWGHQVATVADVDLDDRLELVQGDAVWTWSDEVGDLVLEPWSGGPVPYSGTSVADFGAFPGSAGDAPGRPEVVVDTALGLQIQTIEGERVLGPYPVHTEGGLLLDLFSIGDVDGDGVPEISAPRSLGELLVIDPDCSPTGGVGTCASGSTDGVLWRAPVLVETGGTSVFDFDGDGRVEVVFADWCYVRVVDGADGTVLWSGRRSSGGWHEMPVVADVDGDYHAEIVSVSAHGSYVLGTCPLAAVDPYFPGLRCEVGEDCPTLESTCDAGLCRCASDEGCGDPELACVEPLPGSAGSGRVCRSTWAETDGVRVYADVGDRWAGSRMIWNQHAYAVTNVGDSGIIPRGSETRRNWETPGLNDFRRNVQLAGHAADDVADLTVGGLEAPECDVEAMAQPLSARVCNRGTLAVAAGVDVSFRLDSVEGEELCVATTDAVLEPGLCVEVGCLWDGVVLNEEHEVIAIVDGDGESPVAECHEDNNAASAAVRCPPVLG